MYSDDVLMQQLRAGQSTALRTIYQRYAQLVHTLALRIVKSTEEAEDITQEIFLVLFHQGCYDAQRGSLKNFLAMKTKSRAIDRLRSHHTYHRAIRRRCAITGSDSTNTPLEQVIQNQAVHQVRQALLSLSRKEREVLESAYYDGLSQSQIACQLRIPLGTVKSRSRQGLQKLRYVLDNN
ncbi:MAG: sigma-70 family RNA polymerase sigma factor [Cyanobacteria bacterium P01_F01_bin.53]